MSRKMSGSCADVAVTFMLYLVLTLPLSSSVSAAPPQTSSTSQSHSPPCKQFNGTMFDCSARNLSAVPTDIQITATGLDLSMNEISDLHEYIFNNLPLLVSLNLSQALNAIQTLGDNIFRGLVSLQTLDLSQNGIHYIAPDAFSGLVELLRLDLSKNSIVSIPAEAFRDLRNLNHLSLFFNGISEVPSDAMAHLTKVHTLDLSLNLFGGFGFELGEGFQAMKSLERLLLRGMNIQYLPDSAFSVLHSLPVKLLDLSFNSLYVVGNSTFRPLENLRQLSLANTFYDGLAMLSSGLHKLDLAGGIPDVVQDGTLAVRVVRRLSWYLPNITAISFARSSIAKIEDNALGHMQTLLNLDLSRNLLQELHLRDKTFEGLNNLQELDLSANNLGKVPSDALSAFNLSHSLRLLNLADNHVRRLNADTFMFVPFLASLNLKNNRISSLGGSLKILEKLEYLNLASNDLYRLPPIGWKSALPNLHVLDISHNEGGEYVINTLSYLAPDLKELYVNNIEVDFQFSLLLNCTSLVTLDVSENGIGDDSFYEAGKFGWTALTLPRLENLYIGGNTLTFLSANVFEGITQVRRINISHNALTTVHNNTFADLKKLEILDLSNNALLNISALTPELPSLRSVNFSWNKVSFVDVELLVNRRQPSLRVLDLSENTYSCTCEIEDFHDWLLQDTRVFLPSPSAYRCNSPEDLQGTLVARLVLDFCVSYLGLYLGVGFASGLVLIVIVVVACVRYHWHLRYKFFLMFRRGLIRRNDEIAAEQANNNEHKFDAFVSYNDHDREWVLQQLIPHLEDHQEDDKRFQLCVSDRDLPAGDSKVDVIVEAIQSSCKTILVLSDHFLNSEWCYYEMQMAHLRLFNESRDVLVLILLGEISDCKMTMLLRKTLCRKNYLKWPRDGLGQQLFWDRLREELKTTPTVNHRLDV